jgi:serine/threonine protein kinase
MGSYGVVWRGKWKGVDVAVKRFIKQKLEERRMLEFRAEMAFLAELHHPNIVLFIGTRVVCRVMSCVSCHVVCGC